MVGGVKKVQKLRYIIPFLTQFPYLQSLPSFEGLVAVGAHVATLVLVHQQVLAQRAPAVEHAVAHVARVRRVLMSVHVGF